MTPTPRTPDTSEHEADWRRLIDDLMPDEYEWRQVEDLSARLALIRQEAVQEAESQIRADAVKPWREALWGTRARELNIDGSPCWCDDYPLGNAHHPQCVAARSLLDHTGEGESG